MATQSQIKKLHVLFTNLQLMDEKKSIISDVTNGRTQSTKELTDKEATDLIGHLCEFLPCEKLKSAIRYLAYRANMIYGNSETDKILNKVKIDMFLHQKGAVKKDLEKQNYQELIKTHRQFEAICANNSRSVHNKTANKAVKELLNELNLTVI
jgi:hypothetical protein